MQTQIFANLHCEMGINISQKILSEIRRFAEANVICSICKYFPKASLSERVEKVIMKVLVLSQAQVSSIELQVILL
jgi:hypothetical protein